MATERVSLDVDDVVRRYRAGESEYALARQFGVDRSTVRHRLLGAGVPIRSMSKAGRMRASRMTADERMAQAAAAHKAATGRQKTFAEKCLAAITKQERGLFISGLERHLHRLLTERGVAAVQQQAVGPYNCDLALHPVAVEVFGGGWHWYGSHGRAAPERIRYFLNRGWHMLLIAVDRRRCPLTGGVADYIVSYVQELRSLPARKREYRVIRGAGELLAIGYADDEEISIKPALRSSRDALGRYTSVPR